LIVNLSTGGVCRVASVTVGRQANRKRYTPTHTSTHTHTHTHTRTSLRGASSTSDFCLVFWRRRVSDQRRIM